MVICGIRDLSRSIRTQILTKSPLATEVVMVSKQRKVPVVFPIALRISGWKNLIGNLANLIQTAIDETFTLAALNSGSRFLTDK